MIWCDLDNTLIWTWDPLITTPFLSTVFNQPIESKPPSGKGRRRLTRVEVRGYGAGYVCTRRSAKPFLRELRRLDRVMLLTNAVRVYAEAMNLSFSFGFAREEMITREQLLGKAGTDPKAVLVDNEARFGSDSNHCEARARKLRYLGISQDAVIEVPYFQGRMEDEFEFEWPNYIARVAAALRR